MALQRLGPYLILERIGVGGQGEVYRALHEPLKRQVALKVLLSWRDVHEEDRIRFEREIKLACTLVHPALVRVLDGDAGGVTPYLAMELLDGEPLDRRLVAHGRMPVREVRAIGAQLAAGLAHLHAAGILHRDVKPSNVFLCRDGSVRLLDFGLAKRREATLLTEPGTVIGTLQFMAPELLRANADATASSDLWALGATLYVMIAGAVHVRGNGVAEMMAAITAQEIVPPSRAGADVPPDLDEPIMRMLDRNPATRLSDAVTAAALLEGVRPPRPPATSPRNPAPVRDNRVEPSAPTQVLPHPARERFGAPRRGPAAAVLAAMAMAGLMAAAARREPAPTPPTAPAEPGVADWIFDHLRNERGSRRDEPDTADWARSLARSLDSPSAPAPSAPAASPDVRVDEQAQRVWERSVPRPPVPLEIAAAALDVLRARPARPEGWLALGRALELEGRSEARSAYARGIELARPADLRIAPRFVWAALARALLTVPRRKLELDWWTWADQAGSPRAACSGLRDALESSDLDRLDSMLELSSRRPRLATTAALLRGHVAIETRRDPSRARAVWRDAVSRPPAKPDVVRVLADHLLARGLVSQARSLLVRYDPDGWRLVALALLEGGSRELPGGARPELVELATFLALARGDLAAAEALWSAAPAGALPAVAFELCGAGSRLPWLEPALRRALFTDRPDGGTWFVAAGALATPAGAPLMARLLDEADARWRESPVPPLALALLKMRTGDHAAARNALEVARRRNPLERKLVPVEAELEGLRVLNSGGRPVDAATAAARFDLEPEEPIWALLEVHALRSPADRAARRAAIERLRASVVWRRGGLWVLRALPPAN